MNADQRSSRRRKKAQDGKAGAGRECPWRPNPNRARITTPDYVPQLISDVSSSLPRDLGASYFLLRLLQHMSEAPFDKFTATLLQGLAFRASHPLAVLMKCSFRLFIFV